MAFIRLLLVVGMTCVIAGACGRDGNQDLDQTPRDSPAYPAGDPLTSTTVADVMNNPSAFTGQRVVISGEVTEVWAPRAFTIGGEQFLENDQLLVVSREDLPRIAARAAREWLAPTDIVQVSGTVYLGALGDVERNVAFDLPAAAERVWQPDRPVLVAERVIVTPRRVVTP